MSSHEATARAGNTLLISVAAASTLAGRTARDLGEPLSLSDTGGLSLVFPSAKVLAETTLTGLPQVRASAIRSLARAFVSARVESGQIDEALLAGLAKVKGIGEWTVQYIALRALGQPDAFPVSDLVLLRVAGEGHPLTVAALRERAERWRPWRGYAAVYLWRSAADEPEDLRTVEAGSVVGAVLARLSLPTRERVARRG